MLEILQKPTHKMFYVTKFFNSVCSWPPLYMPGQDLMAPGG